MSITSEAETSLAEQPAPNTAEAADGHQHVASGPSVTGETSTDRQRLHLALAVGNVFTWEVDLATDALTCSPNVAEILGFPVGPTLDSAMSLVHPDDRADLQQWFQRGTAGRPEFDAEFRLVHPQTGDQVWVRSRGCHVPVDGASDRFIGASQQITDQKRQEMHATFLTAIQRDLSGSADEEAIPRAVAERIARYFDFALLTLVEGDANGDPTTVIYRHGPDDGQTVDIVDAVQPAGTLVPSLRARQTVTIDDALLEPGELSGTAPFEGGAMRSAILVPSAGNRRWTLLLGGYRRQPCHWRKDEIETLEDVTARLRLRLERVRSEAARRASDMRYRTLTGSIAEGFCVIEMLFDDDGTPVDYRFLEVNPAFERQTGLRQVEGKRILEIAPAHEAHWFEIYGRVAITGEPVSFEQEATAIGGRWFEVDAVRLGDPANRHVAVIFRDITERKRADDAVRESEARLRRAIAIETVGVVFFRDDGVITYANDAFLRMSGYTTEDVGSGEVRWDTITPPEWMPRTREANEEFAGTGRMAPFEKEYLRKDGSRWWSLCAATRLDAREGVKFIIDITGSKRATAEQARLAAMVDFSRDAFIGTEVDGTITSWNPAATRLFGYTAEEAVGMNVLVLIPPGQAHERERIVDQLQRGEVPAPLETQRLRKNGSRIDVEIRPSHIRDAAGRLAGVAIVATDATERRRLERAQEDFLAMASHDLRSPVTVLRGRAQWMKRRKTYDEAGINVILDQARRIERLTDDLREIVRLEAGKIDLERTMIDLRKLVSDAADRLRIQQTTDRVRVITPAAPIAGLWDRDRIGQILDNLLENAAKYADAESTITVEVSRAENEARISVMDRGPGIAPAELSRLFDRFYRVDGAGAAGGLGLGLYISRMLVEAQGGRIWAESTLGQGSTFTATLPIAS
ncbi:MAG TPA: PAS domain S-box protein [Thermomicrobiales bacterium]|nr:PAS domain S-box protein [Thermomicrobiales bacterium]